MSYFSTFIRLSFVLIVPILLLSGIEYTDHEFNEFVPFHDKISFIQ